MRLVAIRETQTTSQVRCKCAPVRIAQIKHSNIASDPRDMKRHVYVVGGNADGKVVL